MSVSQKRHALGGTHFCAQPRGRNSFPLISPWGQKFNAEPRTRPQGGSHTLSVKFPCMCPVHPHMSTGRDFFDSLKALSRMGEGLILLCLLCLGRAFRVLSGLLFLPALCAGGGSAFSRSPHGARARRGPHAPCTSGSGAQRQRPAQRHTAAHTAARPASPGRPGRPQCR